MTSPVIIDQKKLKASGLPVYLQVLITQLITQLINLANRPAVKGAPGRGIQSIASDPVTGALTIMMSDGVQVVTPALIAADGASAYDLAVAGGFAGTVSEWLISLRGEDGEPGASETALPAGAATLWPENDPIPAGWFSAGTVPGGWVAISQTEIEPPDTVAPAVTEPPSILPANAGIGDSVTLDIGAASGTPAPAATWALTLDGTDISGDVDPEMAIELTDAGEYLLSVTWTNSAGSATDTASLTVEAAAPTIDYAQAIAYIDTDSTYAGSASAVTSITSTGQQGLVFAAAGSGNPITHSSAGFTFADGVYVQSPNLTPGSQPTGDGVFAVVDFTLTGYGSSAGQLLQGGGGRINVLDVGGTLRIQAAEDSSVNTNGGATPYGTRFVVGGRMDDVLDLLGSYDVTGTYNEQAYANTNPDLTRIITGRYINGTLHRLAVFGRPEGGAWPASFEDVFADFRAGV